MVNRGLPRWFSGKESTCNAGDMSLIPRSRRCLGGGMTTHSNILAWDVLWTEKSGELQSMELQKYQTRLNSNNMGNKVSHLLPILLPGGLKQIIYLCQYVYLEYRLFLKMQSYITTVKQNKTKQELYKTSRKDTHLPNMSYIPVSHLFSFYCSFKSGQIRST